MTAYRRRNPEDKVMLVDRTILLLRRIVQGCILLILKASQFSFAAVQLLFTGCFAAAYMMLRIVCCCCFIPFQYLTPNLTEEEKGLVYRLREKAQVPYDAENNDHRRTLCLLYRYAFSEESESLPHSMLSEKWKDVGFQSNDPAKDFRGGGLISLQHLVYYAESNHCTFRRLVNLSQASRYMLALTSIRLTFFMLKYFGLDSKTPLADPQNMETSMRRKLKNLCTFISQETNSSVTNKSLEPRLEGYARLHGLLMDLHFAAWTESTWTCDPGKLRSAEHACQAVFSKVIESKLFDNFELFDRECMQFDVSWLTKDDIGKKVI